MMLGAADGCLSLEEKDIGEDFWWQPMRRKLAVGKALRPLRHFIIGGMGENAKRGEERTRSHGLELLRSVDTPGV